MEVNMQVNSDDKGDNVKQVAEQLWRSVLSDFENEAVHNTFIQYCSATQQLSFAGEKYKSYREAKGDSPLIESCMKKIVIHAQSHCLPDSQRNRTFARGPVPRLIVCLFFLMVGIFLVFVWISYPALRFVFLLAVIILGGVMFYRLKRKGLSQ
jgi:hypothetical protein